MLVNLILMLVFVSFMFVRSFVHSTVHTYVSKCVTNVTLPLCQSDTVTVTVTVTDTTKTLSNTNQNRTSHSINGQTSHRRHHIFAQAACRPGSIHLILTSRMIHIFTICLTNGRCMRPVYNSSALMANLVREA